MGTFLNRGVSPYINPLTLFPEMAGSTLFTFPNQIKQRLNPVYEFAVVSPYAYLKIAFSVLLNAYTGTG